ncbi:hypothetical protein HNW13_018265 [Shewanella sp. BF02_Schw]|uniref:hypothetical protein n=1 Tax=Shewanella sp. BF02_Schw TaxID=394908 RepID=UPI00177BE7E9|nr:hypothetical protein [Shewanella sp. BF02_Schw]MBO1897686.1 hypothetical protein [Shewanella sp. BF02_Schw]
MAIKNLLGGDEIKPLNEVMHENNSIVPHSLFLQSVMEEITSMVPIDATADDLCHAFRSDPQNTFLVASLTDVGNRATREEVRERIAEDLMKNGSNSQFNNPKPH